MESKRLCGLVVYLRQLMSLVCAVMTAKCISVMVTVATEGKYLVMREYFLLGTVLLASFLLNYLLGVYADNRLEGEKEKLKERAMRHIFGRRNLTNAERVVRVNEDTEKFLSYRVTLPASLLAAACILLFLIIYVVGINPLLGIEMVVLNAVNVVMVPIIQRKYEASYEEYVSLDDEITQSIQSSLENLSAIKLNGLNGILVKYLKLKQDKMYKVSVDIEKIFQKSEMFINAIDQISRLIFYLTMGIGIGKGYFELSDGAQLVVIYGYMQSQITEIVSLNKQRIEGKVAQKRLEFGSDVEKADEKLPEVNVRAAHIEFDEVSFAYDNADKTLKFSGSIGSGESIGIFGPNGSGKSTFLRLMTGLIEPQSGRISVNGHKVADMSSSGRGSVFTLITQSQQLLPLSVGENFLIWGISDETKAKKTLAEFDIEDKWEQRGDTLSAGEQKKVLLCIGMMRSRPCTILDEPDNFLDSRSLNTYIKLIEGQDSVTRIYVTHDPEWLKLCDRQIDIMEVYTENELQA